MKVLAKEKMKLQHSVLKYPTDLYSLDYKLAVEIDERGHLDRNEDKQKERENKIKETLKCKFVRINPDRKKFDVFVEIGKKNDIIDEIIEKRKNESIDNIKKNKKYVVKVKKRNREISKYQTEQKNY